MAKLTKTSLKNLQSRVQKLSAEKKVLSEELKALQTYLILSKSKQEKLRIEQLLKDIK